MKKFPKVKYPSDPSTHGLFNDDVAVTEKVDGANFRFQLYGDDQVVIGTRNTVQGEAAAGGGYKPLPLSETNRSFRHTIRFLYDNVPFGDVPAKAYDCTFFGEAMHRHSLTYSEFEYTKPPSGSPYPKQGPNVLMFDVFDEAAGKWLPWDEVKEMANGLNLPFVPILGEGTKEEVTLEVPEESGFGGNPEGIVVRRWDGAVRAKKVTDDFKETNAIEFNDPTKAQSDSAEFVAMYITPQRVESVARGLVDDGHYDGLAMEMMQDLPREVLVDAVQENAWDLFTNEFECKFDDDFKSEIRSKVTKKCARELKSIINEF